MITIKRKAVKPGAKAAKKRSTFSAKIKTSRGFEKGWAFWKTAQIDLSNFKFDREEANAR